MKNHDQNLTNKWFVSLLFFRLFLVNFLVKYITSLMVYQEAGEIGQNVLINKPVKWMYCGFDSHWIWTIRQKHVYLMIWPRNKGFFTNVCVCVCVGEVGGGLKSWTTMKF